MNSQKKENREREDGRDKWIDKNRTSSNSFVYSKYSINSDTISKAAEKVKGDRKNQPMCEKWLWFTWFILIIDVFDV